jgi:hypothetical protein
MSMLESPTPAGTFLGVLVATLFALLPVKRLSCGDWYLRRDS